MEEENETEEVPVCDFCLLPAQQSEADIVELRCNTRGCKDYEGATYHFECISDFLRKRNKHKHASAQMLAKEKFIDRGDLQVFPCVHCRHEDVRADGEELHKSKKSDSYCGGRIKESVLLKHIKPRPAPLPAIPRPRAPRSPPKPPAPAKLTRPHAPLHNKPYIHVALRTSAPAPISASPPKAPSGPPPGAEFVSEYRPKRAPNAAPISFSGMGGLALAAQPAMARPDQPIPTRAFGTGNEWWAGGGGAGGDTSAYAPSGFDKLRAPLAFSASASSPLAAALASAAGLGRDRGGSGGLSVSAPSFSPLASRSPSPEWQQPPPEWLAERHSPPYTPPSLPAPPSSTFLRAPRNPRDVDALFAQLLEMGFDEAQAMDAAQCCDTLEAALATIESAQSAPPPQEPSLLDALAAQARAPPVSAPQPQTRQTPSNFPMLAFGDAEDGEEAAWWAAALSQRQGRGAAAAAAGGASGGGGAGGGGLAPEIVAALAECNLSVGSVGRRVEAALRAAETEVSMDVLHCLKLKLGTRAGVKNVESWIIGGIKRLEGFIRERDAAGRDLGNGAAARAVARMESAKRPESSGLESWPQTPEAAWPALSAGGREAAAGRRDAEEEDDLAFMLGLMGA